MTAFYQYALVFAVQVVLAVIINLAFSLWFRKDRKAEKVLDPSETTPAKSETLITGRLSAQQFIQKLRDAELWSIRAGFNEIELIVWSKDGLAGKREWILGPDPVKTEIGEYQDFVKSVNEITGAKYKIENKP
jgi:hypothetical protein